MPEICLVSTRKFSWPDAVELKINVGQSPPVTMCTYPTRCSGWRRRQVSRTQECALLLLDCQDSNSSPPSETSSQGWAPPNFGVARGLLSHWWSYWRFAWRLFSIKSFPLWLTRRLLVIVERRVVNWSVCEFYLILAKIYRFPSEYNNFNKTFRVNFIVIRL